MLRRIDQCLDLSALRQHLADYYSQTGRPSSIDPELLIRMLIIGYCYGIRSERRLCEEVHLNLAYRWFCRLGLEDPVPDHSTFSKNRQGRFRESDAFRWLFDDLVRRCMEAGLIQGEGFAVDASVIAADASRQRSVPGNVAVDWTDPVRRSRAVREYLAALEDTPGNETAPKRISLTDPQARWTAAKGERAFFAYSTNYLIDTAHGIILNVEATPARWLGVLRPPPHINDPAANARRSKCCFAHLKRILKLDRLRWRGLQGAADEFILAAAVQNFRCLARFVASPG